MFQLIFGAILFFGGVYFSVMPYVLSGNIHHDRGAMYVGGGALSMTVGLFHFLSALGFGQ